MSLRLPPNIPTLQLEVFKDLTAAGFSSPLAAAAVIEVEAMAAGLSFQLLKAGLLGKAGSAGDCNHFVGSGAATDGPFRLSRKG